MKEKNTHSAHVPDGKRSLQLVLSDVGGDNNNAVVSIHPAGDEGFLQGGQKTTGKKRTS